MSAAPAGASPDGRAAPRARRTALARRDPTVVLATLLVVSLLLLVPVDPWTPLTLLVLTVAAARAAAVPWSTLARGLASFGPFALSVLAVNLVTRPGAPVARVAGLTVTDVGVLVGTGLALRTVLVGTLAVVVAASLDPVRLVASLHRHARLGARGAAALLAAHRVLEQLPARWVAVRQAQAARLPGPRPTRAGALPTSPDLLVRAAFTLLVVTLRQAQQMAVTLETRGVGSGPRTVHRPARLGAGDAVLAAVAVGTTVVVGAVLWRLGLLETWASVGG
ncbi:energy-coupling factor transporter transmembrane component T family protein [Cellulomonas telluris]|uniref:energy-coupling factor transporter transmembrane component T family protein n=1 Tax=Cellulomonas telluris TaxID=2306636 RepID=UPI0010A84877|nr:energy-coupling factor transporter transmembrane component T [Cellulomonas telluris]